MSAIRILMVDDHSLFRESLSRLLEAVPDFRVVGQCATVTEAIGNIGRAGAVGKRRGLGPECLAVRAPVFLSLVKCV